MAMMDLERLLGKNEKKDIPKKKWADLFAEALVRQDGDVEVFGVPGGATLEAQDALYRYGIPFILFAHEQGAVVAAEGYSRSSNKTGVVMVTSGPGATNTLTGQADAEKDSKKLVTFGGQVPTPVLYADAFQGVDVARAAVPLVKKVMQFRDQGNWQNLWTNLRHWWQNVGYRVYRAEELEKVIEDAFRIARGGTPGKGARPGPVYVEIPKDVSQKQIAASQNQRGISVYSTLANMFETSTRTLKKSFEPYWNYAQRKKLDKALEAILNSDYAVIYWGGGIINAGAQNELLRFMQRTGIPGTYTLNGKFGEAPDETGMLGMHGEYVFNYMLRKYKPGKVVIALGTKFDDRVVLGKEEFAQGAEIIHVDIDHLRINKVKRAHHPLVADVKDVLAYWNKKLEDKKYDTLPERWKHWRDELREVRSTYPLDYDRRQEDIMPHFIVETLNQCVDDYIEQNPTARFIYTTGVGRHQMTAAQLAKKGQWISSGGLGAMGFGLPAALGAQVANKDAYVINLDGDGSFNMTANELATAVRYNLPVVTIVFEDGYLGMVGQWQDNNYGGRRAASKLTYGSDNSLPDYAKIAEGYGAAGMLVNRKEELKPAILKAFSNRSGPTVIVVETKDHPVYPMIDPGKKLEDTKFDHALPKI